MWYQAPYCGTRSQNCLVCKIGLLRWIWFHKLELLWPKKLKISFNKIDEILIVTLKIYTCSCWRFRLWIVLDSFLSNNPLTDVAKSLWTMRRALSWKWFILLLSPRLWIIQTKEWSLNWEIMNDFISLRHFKVIYWKTQLHKVNSHVL